MYKGANWAVSNVSNEWLALNRYQAITTTNDELFLWLSNNKLGGVSHTDGNQPEMNKLNG